MTVTCYSPLRTRLEGGGGTQRRHGQPYGGRGGGPSLAGTTRLTRRPFDFGVNNDGCLRQIRSVLCVLFTVVGCRVISGVSETEKGVNKNIYNMFIR